MRSIQEKMNKKTLKLQNDMKEITEFAKGSDMNACTKGYKLFIRLVDAGMKYDISRSMRTQLKLYTKHLIPRVISTPNGGTRTILVLPKFRSR